MAMDTLMVEIHCEGSQRAGYRESGAVISASILAVLLLHHLRELGVRFRARQRWVGIPRFNRTLPQRRNRTCPGCTMRCMPRSNMNRNGSHFRPLPSGFAEAWRFSAICGRVARDRLLPNISSIVFTAPGVAKILIPEEVLPIATAGALWLADPHL